MATRGADTETTRYIYFCKWCTWTFEVFLDAGASAPAAARCPVCDAPDAHLVGAADESTPPGGYSPPGTGCCGTRGSS